ncbi:MAG: hypothetical protein K0S72_1066, partial [Arthrobacter sp.]|nr:hypothetical protein [Arthrobacter sp.]
HRRPGTTVHTLAKSPIPHHPSPNTRVPPVDPNTIATFCHRNAFTQGD